MPKNLTIRQITDLSEMFRSDRGRDVIEVEYRKGSHLGLLRQFRFSRNERTGKPTKRQVECLDGTEQRCFDGKYDFEVTAIIVDGQRNDIEGFALHKMSRSQAVTV